MGEVGHRLSPEVNKSDAKGWLSNSRESTGHLVEQRCQSSRRAALSEGRWRARVSSRSRSPIRAGKLSSHLRRGCHLRRPTWPARPPQQRPRRERRGSPCRAQTACARPRGRRSSPTPSALQRARRLRALRGLSCLMACAPTRLPTRGRAPTFCSRSATRWQTSAVRAQQCEARIGISIQKK